MSASFRFMFPEVYRRLLPDFFDQQAVEEPRATCDNCVMCDRGTNPNAVHANFFRPDIKCCTYFPSLPNYLVGATLADDAPESAEGARRLREIIGKRIGVTPRSVAAPRKYRVLLDAARLTSFGRSDALVCPYYARESGMCTIWKNRESVCATFFCKYGKGGSGWKFWMGLKQWFIHVEGALADHVAREVAPAHVQPQVRPGTLTLEDLEDRPPPPDEYTAMFGPWTGREPEFYVACFRRAQALTEGDFRRIVGARGDELLAQANANHESLVRPKLAKKLRLNPDMPTTRGDGGVVVTPYWRYDSFFLPDAVYDALAKFGPDENVDATLARLKKEHDIELAPEGLLEMQLFEVMVPVE